MGCSVVGPERGERETSSPRVLALAQSHTAKGEGSGAKASHSYFQRATDNSSTLSYSMYSSVERRPSYTRTKPHVAHAQPLGIDPATHVRVNARITSATYILTYQHVDIDQAIILSYYLFALAKPRRSYDQANPVEGLRAARWWRLQHSFGCQRADKWPKFFFFGFTQRASQGGHFEPSLVFINAATAKLCPGKAACGPGAVGTWKSVKSPAGNKRRPPGAFFGNAKVSTQPVCALSDAAAHEGSSKMLASPANCSDKTC
jgi:hypothetical protein